MNRDPHETRLAIVLRAIATFDLLAIVAMVMPASWMAATHSWLGLGELTLSPVFLYLARTVSLLYAFHGVTLWYMAGDVRRYRPLIAFLGPLTVASVPIFVWIDTLAALPWWWIVGEAVCLAAMGLAMVVMERQLDRPAKATGAKHLSAVERDPAEMIV